MPPTSEEFLSLTQAMHDALAAVAPEQSDPAIRASAIANVFGRSMFTAGAGTQNGMQIAAGLTAAAIGQLYTQVQEVLAAYPDAPPLCSPEEFCEGFLCDVAELLLPMLLTLSGAPKGTTIQ